MGAAKQIVVKVIDSKSANAFVKIHHYSGKVVNNSLLHFGCFLNDRLGGVMSFGNPIDRRKLIGLVVDGGGETARWSDFLELNRMAFSDALPRNSESRCFSIAIRLLRKNAPHIKWIVSFSDATQCGDGCIYRASGFILSQIRKSDNDLWRTPTSLGWGGQIVHRIAIHAGGKGAIPSFVLRKYGTYNISIKKLVADNGGEALIGFQLRYIYIQ
ncbi:MAG: hypothetical protein ACRCVX_14295 [Shewanella sp.]